MLTNPLQIIYAFLTARGLNISSEKSYVHRFGSFTVPVCRPPRTMVECETNSGGVPALAIRQQTRRSPPWRAT